MMAWAGITEDELRFKKEIQIPFGETLSEKYLCYASENSLPWNIPTNILCGENDNRTSCVTITEFTKRLNATLTVMKNREHWFHTEEQMKFLDDWIRQFSV